MMERTAGWRWLYQPGRSVPKVPGLLAAWLVLGGLILPAVAGPVCFTDPQGTPTGQFVPGGPCPVEELLQQPRVSIFDSAAGRALSGLPGLLPEALLGLPIRRLRGPYWPWVREFPVAGRLDWEMVWASALESAAARRPCGEGYKEPCLARESIVRLLEEDLLRSTRVKILLPQQLEVSLFEVEQRVKKQALQAGR